MENQSVHKAIMIIQAVTNVHCGVGQGTGDIDLPTAKEAATGFPLIPGSTIKGVLRDHYSRNSPDKNLFKAAFGPSFANDPEDAHASALMFTDARVLLLPVRSAVGVFTLATCPLVLQRFARDLRYAGQKVPGTVPKVDKDSAKVGPSSANLIKGKLVLEDIDLKAVADDPDWQAWATALRGLPEDNGWAEEVVSPRLALIHDDVFSFLCQVGLPVHARIRIDEKTGTVAKGALWYEESIPAETFFTSIAAASASSTKPTFSAKAIAAAYLMETMTLQLGGKATTGKGLCRLRYTQGVGA